MNRNYFVSDEALDQASQLGVGGDIENRVLRMARRAAPMTDPFANWRFDDFKFLIAGGIIWSVLPLEYLGPHPISKAAMEGIDVQS